MCMTVLVLEESLFLISSVCSLIGILTTRLEPHIA